MSLFEEKTVFKTRQKRAGRRTSQIYLDFGDDTEHGNILPRPSTHRRIVFGWYGGKFSHLEWLLPLLPACHHYCEPFSGSGAVILNRIPSPVETYNDIDGEVVNFFRVLRNQPEELIRLISLTPFSREEFYMAINIDTNSISPLERARNFYVRARQARTGLAQTASLGRWANCLHTSRAGMSGAVSRWTGGFEALDGIVERLMRVQIENRPAVDAISLYDNSDTLFYCDPPYLHETRGDTNSYGFEMNIDDHQTLADLLRGCKGKVALSGYRCAPMDSWYKDWNRYDAPLKNCHSSKQMRQECLWMNY